MCQRSLARAFAVALFVWAPPSAVAQEPCSGPAPVVVGSEWESYLRLMQVTGATEPTAWSVRAFGPRQWSSLTPPDSVSPWGTFPRGARSMCQWGRRVVVWPTRAQVIFNSGFPFGENDGALWAGRGLTVAADAGVTGSFGRVTLTLAPQIFASQNAAFSLTPTGVGGATGAFADWQYPENIDLPQRFGSKAFVTLDPGESGARVDFRSVAFGVTTAHQFWGPAIDHPMILGSNAAGIPHVFVETAQPINVWRLGRVTARTFLGKLTGSGYSPPSALFPTHIASGIAAVFMPRGLRGLEVGGARFFHVDKPDWRHTDMGVFLKPFGGLFLPERDSSANQDNQLASAFFRLVLPSDGVEVYGEYGREDRSSDFRMLSLTPDFDAAYLVGLRKAWRGAGTVTSLRAEVLNTRITHLALSRDQVPWYVHGAIPVGHTNRGQPLGSVGGYGGGASVLALDRYTARGRTTFRWERIQLGEFLDASQPVPELVRNEVAHIWSVNSLRFGRRTDVEFGVAAIEDFNRHFEGDAFSVRTSVSVVPNARRTPK